MIAITTAYGSCSSPDLAVAHIFRAGYGRSRCAIVYVCAIMRNTQQSRGFIACRTRHLVAQRAPEGGRASQRA